MIQPDLRCYHHPDREATSQCDRCGDYLCAQCMKEHRKQYLCERCLRDVTRPKRGSAWIGAWTELPVVLLLHVFVVLVSIELFVLNERVFLLFWISIIAGFFLWVEVRTRFTEKGEIGPKKLFVRAAVRAFSYWGIPLAMGLRFSSKSGRWYVRDISYGPSIIVSLIAGVILVLAYVNWLRAVKKGIRPLWMVIALLVIILTGLCTNVAGVCSALVEKWGLFRL